MIPGPVGLTPSFERSDKSVPFASSPRRCGQDGCRRRWGPSRRTKRPHGRPGTPYKEAFMRDVFILDAVRTPRGRGKAGKGALSGVHPQELLAQTLNHLAKRNGLDRSK